MDTDKQDLIVHPRGFEASKSVKMIMVIQTALVGGKAGRTD